jgi:hypothetical protein
MLLSPKSRVIRALVLLATDFLLLAWALRDVHEERKLETFQRDLGRFIGLQAP